MTREIDDQINRKGTPACRMGSGGVLLFLSKKSKIGGMREFLLSDGKDGCFLQVRYS